jgi:hypothetical protein
MEHLDPVANWEVHDWGSSNKINTHFQETFPLDNFE